MYCFSNHVMDKDDLVSTECPGLNVASDVSEGLVLGMS